MTPKLDMLQIKRQLLDARQEIAGSQGLREEVRIERAADMLDQVQALEARELAVRNLDCGARRLRQIEEALRRLDTGEYGTCMNCEQPVGPQRLRAIPWAPLCLKCQEIADQNEGALSRHFGDQLLVNAA